MIRNVAELLEGFLDEECSKLKEYELKHAPTIGDMYEGLSADLLNRSIPSELGLKIVDGFITDGSDYLSGQMDCMLVRGEGEQVPFTKSYKWHVKDVLVVFEVKKNLYSSDLINSFYKLRQVAESYSKYLFKEDRSEEENKKIDLSSSYNIFSQLTGVTAPSYFDRETLSKENELIYTTIFMEQLTPVRIVLGYDGFNSEFGLREGFFKFLEKEGMGAGYGVPSFPQLIICGKNSLVKGNGRPYLFPIKDKYWDFMVSTKASPILLMLELIWSKISLEYEIDLPWGEDLEMESMNKFLSAKPVFTTSQGGWKLKYHEITKEKLELAPTENYWEPTEVSSQVFTVFQHLSQGNVVTSDPDFREFALKYSSSVKEFIDEITSTSLASYDGEKLSLTSTDLCTAALPDGRFVIAENNVGLFTSWLSNRA